MKNTNIEWTDESANPIRVKGGGFYCYKVSEGQVYLIDKNQFPIIPPLGDFIIMHRYCKKATGHLLEGQVYQAFPNIQ